mgnify:CR=1 FL=1
MAVCAAYNDEQRQDRERMAAELNEIGFEDKSGRRNGRKDENKGY